MSQKKFYQLYAYFNSIDESGGVDAGGNAKPVLALPTEAQLGDANRLRQEIETVERRLPELPAVTAVEQQAWEEETSRWLTIAEQGQLWQPLQQVELACKSRVDWTHLSDQTPVDKRTAAQRELLASQRVAAG